MSKKYSSKGKISELIIFDHSPLTKPVTVFDELDKIYSTLTDYFSRHHPVDIYIFFTLQYSVDFPLPKQFSQKTKSATNPNVLYICTNCFIKENQLDTKWVQDVLISIDEKTWLCNMLHEESGSYGTSSIISSGIIDLFQNMFPDQNWIPVRTTYDGGGLLLGNFDGKDYLLAGDSTCAGDENYLSALFKIDTERIFPVSSAGFTEFDGLLFHIDLYVTIVGPTKQQKDKELILFADPLVISLADGFAVEKPVNKLQDICKQLTAFYQIIDVPATIEKIPLVFVCNSKHQFVLSYNNCHVENYIENGEITINFYFPDFRKSVEKFIKEFSQQDLLTLSADSETAHLTINEQIISAVNKMHGNLNDVIDKCEEQIRTLLLAYEIPNEHVLFVPHNFFELAERTGSLHCMTKVLKRE